MPAIDSAPASPSPAAKPIAVNPTFTEGLLADRLAWLADGGAPEDYPGPGWQTDADPGYDPTPEDLAADLGYHLGADGVPADSVAVPAAVRAAFDAGHNAGDDHLWRVDPLYASHLKEQADRRALDAIRTPMPLRHPRELAEALAAA